MSFPTTSDHPSGGSRAAGVPQEMSHWPSKCDVFGVGVSATGYDEALEAVLEAARSRRPAAVDHMPVHGLIEAMRDTELRTILDRFEIVAPDGQPVRWALNRFHGAGLAERVYGPEFMARLCDRASREGIGIYLLGGRPTVLERLERNLLQRFPGLRVVGRHSPPFRELTSDEFRQIASAIERCEPGLIFLGLGCPKQERYAHRLRELGVRGVQLCVGAAFDFYAGAKPMAPAWLQKRGLEWLFRLAVEPRRLWRRYLVTNSLFLIEYGRRRWSDRARRG